MDPHEPDQSYNHISSRVEYLKSPTDENVIPVDSFFVTQVVIIDEGHVAPLDLPQARPAQFPQVCIVHVERELRRIFLAWTVGKNYGQNAIILEMNDLTVNLPYGCVEFSGRCEVTQIAPSIS